MFTTPPDEQSKPRPTSLRPLGKPYKSVADARSMSVLGVGLVIGAVLGAAAALLVAPQTGRNARAAISRRVRRARGEPVGTWERLGRELKRAATLKRKERELASSRARPDDAAVAL